jgi:hypothetical protein
MIIKGDYSVNENKRINIYVCVLDTIINLTKTKKNNEKLK